MIKAVVFDLDNTIYDYDFCHKKAMAELERYACHAFGISADSFVTAFDQARMEVKELLGDIGASHNRMLYMQLFLEKIHHNPVDGALELYDTYWDTMLQNMQVFPYVIPLLQNLKKLNITVGVLTDLTAMIQHRKIRQLGIAEYIDVLVTSEEAGKEKPSREAFTRLQEKLRYLPEEILMIGDSQKKDVDGAVNMGMNALLFTAEHKNDMGSRVMGYIYDRKN